MCFVCVLHRLNATLFRSHSCALQSSAAALRIGSAVVRVRWCCGLHAALQVHCFIIMRFILFDFPDLTRSRSLDLDLFLSVHDSNLTANNTTRLSVRALKWALSGLQTEFRNNRHFLEVCLVWLWGILK